MNEWNELLKHLAVLPRENGTAALHQTASYLVEAFTKTNLGPCPTSLSYFIKPEAESIRVQWCGESKHRAAELLAVQDKSEPRGGVEEAVEFLKSFLADGPVPATEVRRKAKSAGLAKRTIDRAKKLAKVTARREGFGKGSEWLWELLSKDANE